MSQSLNAPKKEVADKKRRRRVRFRKQLFCNLHSDFSLLTIIIMYCIPVSYIINVFIFLFIYFYTGPILIAVFITEMVILFKHVIIIIIIFMHFSTSKKSQLNLFNLLNYSKEKYALRYPKTNGRFFGARDLLYSTPGIRDFIPKWGRDSENNHRDYRIDGKLESELRD